MTNLFPTLVQFRNKDKAKVGYAAAEALLRGTMFKNCQNTLIFTKIPSGASYLTYEFAKNQHQNAYRLNSNAPPRNDFFETMLNSFGVKIQTRQF